MRLVCLLYGFDLNFYFLIAISNLWFLCNSITTSHFLSIPYCCILHNQLKLGHQLRLFFVCFRCLERHFSVKSCIFLFSNLIYYVVFIMLSSLNIIFDFLDFGPIPETILIFLFLYCLAHINPQNLLIFVVPDFLLMISKIGNFNHPNEINDLLSCLLLFIKESFDHCCW